MKFTCQSSALQKSIGIVEKAISSRTSLPILENIYMELKGNQLTLRGNDLEIGIEHRITVDQAEQDGVTLVKAKTLGSILSKLGNQPLTISVSSDHKMVLQSGKVDFDLLCTSPEDYPVFPNIESGVSFGIGADTLLDFIRYTIFSVSFDETKQFLNGILVKSEQGQLHFVTTDGYRLSLRQDSVEGLTQDLSTIVPYKAMHEVSKVIPQLDISKAVQVTISENQSSFVMGDFVLISRVIKGQFPDYNKVLPKASEHEVKLSRRSLMEACERASIIASSSNNVVRFAFGSDSVVIRASAPSMGDFREELDFSRQAGEGEVKVAFNVKLVLEAIRILESDDVTLQYSNGLSPCVMRATNDESYTYIIMPIRTSDFEQSAPEAAPAAEAPAPAETPAPEPASPVAESEAPAAAPSEPVAEAAPEAPDVPAEPVAEVPTPEAPVEAVENTPVTAPVDVSEHFSSPSVTEAPAPVVSAPAEPVSETAPHMGSPVPEVAAVIASEGTATAESAPSMPAPSEEAIV